MKACVLWLSEEGKYFGELQPVEEREMLLYFFTFMSQNCTQSFDDIWYDNIWNVVCAEL